MSLPFQRSQALPCGHRLCLPARKVGRALWRSGGSGRKSALNAKSALDRLRHRHYHIAMSKATTVPLPSEIMERLETLSELTHRPASFYIQLALEEKLEDIELAYIGESRLEELRASQADVVAWEDVKKENGL